MPIKRPQFVEGEIYHITIRGVEQRKIFMEIFDYQRAIHSLREFNTVKPVSIRDCLDKDKHLPREQFSGKKEAGDDGHVEILGFVFMPNHIHLLLRQVRPEGITNFMRKFGAGYATYFNTKYKRSGHLFQGRFRAAHIDNNEYLKTVFVYIHTNPISIIEPKWKEKGINDRGKARLFLDEYKWSSYANYFRTQKPALEIEIKFLKKVFGGEKRIQEFINGWLTYRQNINNPK